MVSSYFRCYIDVCVLVSVRITTRKKVVKNGFQLLPVLYFDLYVQVVFNLIDIEHDVNA